MIRRILNIKALALVLVTVNTVHALNVGGSLDFDFSTTPYSKCQHLADAINRMQEQYCSPNATNKEYLLKEIKKKKKKLKKCEKECRSIYFPTGAKVNIGYNF